MKEFTITTDTASLALFDIESLKHRLSDTADWWDLEEDLVEEINNGNIGFCGLQSDGTYNIKVRLDPVNNAKVAFNLGLPSGRLFIGPGEEITGANFDPDNSKNSCGKIIDLDIGAIAVSISRTENTIFLNIVPSSDATNSFGSEVELTE